DVLVVDLHALQTIDVLDFVDDVAGQALDALQTQDVVRIGRAVDDHFALVDHLAVVDQHLLLFGNQGFVADAVQVGDDQALLALGVLAERDRAGDVGQSAGVLGRAGLEQFGHAGQTAGNVAGLLGLLRNTGKNLADRNLLPVAHGDQGADRERNVHGMFGAGDLDFFARLVEQLDLRTHHGLARARLGRNDHQRRKAGDLVQLLGHRHAFFDVFEADLAGELGDDGARQRIPVGQTLAGLDDVAVVDRNGRAVGNLVTLALAPAVVENDDLARTRNGHFLALGVGDVTHGQRKAHGTGRLGLDRTGHGRAGSRAADVEGTHGELRTGLADGLGRDNADGFALADHGATAQIAAIAVRAQAVAGFAGKRRADLDFIHSQAVDVVDQILVQQRAGGNRGFLVFGIDDVAGRDAAQDAVAQRLDDFTALDQRLHGVAVRGAAIDLGDDEVLRHVDQTAGQVTRVGRLERRVGQALAGAVGRDEVLQYVPAFAEVRRNGRFNDGAIRLGHQAAHARQLADLGGRTPGAGVGHHVDGVEGLLTHLFAVAIDHGFGGQVLHHRAADLVARLAPDVDHVVVALLGGDQTGRVLLVDLFDLLAGLGKDFFLDRGDQHVAHGDRDAAARGQTETGLHQLVGEDDRGAQAAATERLVDEPGDFLLLERAVQ